MNNIAVCLRGEVRNWNYTKDAVFKFYEDIAYSVDYYYATWDLPYVNQKELDATFSNRKLVQGVLCPSGNDRRRWGGFLGPAFLSSHLKLNKRYDLVIDTRFDVVPVTFPLKGIIAPPADMEIQTAHVEHRWNHEEFENDPTAGGTCDIWAVMNYATWDQFNYRLPVLYDYWIDKINKKTIPTINEIGYTNVLRKMNFTTSHCSWMTNLLTRPTTIDIFPKSTDITFQDWRRVFDDVYENWAHLDATAKRKYCIEQNINFKDYGL